MSDLRMATYGFKRFFRDAPLGTSRFWLHGYGIREPMPGGFVHRPLGTGDYLCMVFHTAARSGTTSDPIAVPAGTLWIWKPGDAHYYGLARRGYLHSWMHCEGEAVRDGLAWCADRLPGAFPEAGPAGLLRLLEGLHEEVSSHPQPDPIITGNLLENWLRDLGRAAEGAGRGTPSRLRAVRDYMERHHATPLSLGQLAARAHWSPSHFSERFRAAYGASPMDYVIQVRLRHAEHLLGDVNLSVSEVARRVGYEDLFHFSKLFKRHRGCCPAKFRRSLIAGSGRD